MNKNKLKFNFHAPRGCRVMSGGFGATTFSSYWWSYQYKRWCAIDEDVGNEGSSTHAPCKTFRSFNRMLRKNPHMIGNLIWCHRSYCVDNDDNFLYDLNIESML